MESENVNENEGLLPAVVAIAVFGFALFVTDFFVASGITYVLCLVWTHPKIKEVGYNRIGTRVLVLEATTLFLITISFFPVSNFFQTLLNVSVMIVTGLIRIIVLDARAQQSSGLFLSNKPSNPQI